MSKPRLVSLALFLSLIAQLGAPMARAQTDEIENERDKREQVRQEKLAVLDDLDPLLATDEALEARVELLKANVEAQQAQLDSVRQKINQARNRVMLTSQAVLNLNDDIVAQKAALSLQAIEAYVRPQEDDMLSQVLHAEDISEAGRRRAFLSSVSQNTRDDVDQLRSMHDQLDTLVQEAEAAELEVIAQQQAELAVLDEIEAALEAAEAAEAELQGRIESLLAEIAGHQAQEDSISNRIFSLMAEEERRKAEAERERILAERARIAAEAIANGADPATALNNSAPAVGTGGMSYPTSGPITSGFGPRWGRMHQGIDISANTGTAVVAARGGTVIATTTSSRGYGNHILINHGDGIVTLYGHLSHIGVSNGAQVAQGATIGQVGSTGNSTGPHLHFEVRVGGVAQDPRSYLG